MIDVHTEVNDRDSQGGPLNGWFTEGAAKAAPFLCPVFFACTDVIMHGDGRAPKTPTTATQMQV